MPELPDVEVFRQYLDRTSLHQTIKKVEALSRDILKGASEKRLRSLVEGKQFESTERRGKYLFAKLSDNGWLAFHFGMTGYFTYFKDSDVSPKHTRALFSFDNGHRLAFILQRKLGKLVHIQSIEDFIKKQGLGPDALEIDLEVFKKALERARSSIKSALTSQERIAGIGNIYSDEILFQSRLYPKAKMNELSDEDLGKLFGAMKKVLNTAIESQADPDRMPNSYLLPHRNKGDKCPGCKGEIVTMKVAGRSTYYCPKCQGK